MIEVELPDGTIAEFPDGTPQDVMKAALQKQFGAPQRGFQVGAAPLSDTLARMPEQAAPEPMGRLEAMRRGFSDMATFGTADEVSGFINSMISGDSYANERDQLRAGLDQAREERPASTLAGGVAGGVAQGLGTAAALGLRGAGTLGGRVLQGMGLGAGEGALYGAGSGEGVADRVSDAGLGGAFGAAVGGLAPVGVEGVRRSWNAIANPIASLGSAPNAVNASRAVETALSRSGMSADEVAEAIQRARAAGQPFTIADATGYSGQRMMAGAARTPGDGRQEIIDFLANRQAGQGRRIGGMLDEQLNAPRNTGNLPAVPGSPAPNDFRGMTAQQVDDALRASRSATADVNYSAARTGAAPVDVRGAVAAIDDRIGPMQGSGIKGDGIDAKLAGYRQRLAAQPPGSRFEGADSVELSDFDRVLGVKQAIQDDIGAAVRAGRNNEARELQKIVAELDSSLEGASDTYRKANDTFRTQSRVIERVEQGKAATSPRARAADTNRAYGAMQPDDQAAYRAGYVDPLLARIEGSAQGVNKARPLMDDASQAELWAMARTPEELAEFLRREDTMFRTTSAASGGSMTADNLADSKDIAGIGANAIVNLLSGRFGAAAQQVGGALMDGMAGRNEATRMEIARLLLSDDVAGALSPALQRSLGNAQRSAVVEALIRSGQRSLSGN